MERQTNLLKHPEALLPFRAVLHQQRQLLVRPIDLRLEHIPTVNEGVGVFAVKGEGRRKREVSTSREKGRKEETDRTTV
jgi:hypothetical protein